MKEPFYKLVPLRKIEEDRAIRIYLDSSCFKKCKEGGRKFYFFELWYNTYDEDEGEWVDKFYNAYVIDEKGNVEILGNVFKGVWTLRKMKIEDDHLVKIYRAYDGPSVGFTVIVWRLCPTPAKVGAFTTFVEPDEENNENVMYDEPEFWPIGVKRDENGVTVYVLGTVNRVVERDGEDIVDYPLIHATVRFDEKGKRAEVRFLEVNGNVLRYDFTSAGRIGNRIVVLEPRNNEAHIFTLDGKYVRTINVSGFPLSDEVFLPNTLLILRNCDDKTDECTVEAYRLNENDELEKTYEGHGLKFVNIYSDVFVVWSEKRKEVHIVDGEKGIIMRITPPIEEKKGGGERRKVTLADTFIRMNEADHVVITLTWEIMIVDKERQLNVKCALDEFYVVKRGEDHDEVRKIGRLVLPWSHDECPVRLAKLLQENGKCPIGLSFPIILRTHELASLLENETEGYVWVFDRHREQIVRALWRLPRSVTEMIKKYKECKENNEDGCAVPTEIEMDQFGRWVVLIANDIEPTASYIDDEEEDEEEGAEISEVWLLALTKHEGRTDVFKAKRQKNIKLPKISFKL